MESLDQWVQAARKYCEDFLSRGDPKTASWPLVDSPLPTLVICVSYVFFVKFLGPRLMKNRDPFDLRCLMVAYNFAMVIVSLMLFLGLGMYGWFGHYNWYCQPMDHSDSEEAIVNAHLAWWFYISKFVEFADTVFFIARKKFGQISTLHIIHHGIMPWSVWWGVKFMPGGHSLFFAFMNSFVHIIMYSYYGLAAIGPQMQKYLWWKRHVTGLQLLQFIAILVHSFQLLLQPDCECSRGFMWWIGFHAFLFLGLFSAFYRDTYSKRGVHAAANNDDNNNAKPFPTNGGPAGIMNSNGHGGTAGSENGGRAATLNGNGCTKITSQANAEPRRRARKV